MFAVSQAPSCPIGPILYSISDAVADLDLFVPELEMSLIYFLQYVKSLACIKALFHKYFFVSIFIITPVDFNIIIKQLQLMQIPPSLLRFFIPSKLDALLILFL